MENKIKINTGKRLIGHVQKIGIRPVLEGRLGGVRESLEGQTMKMAHLVKELIESSIHHSNGLDVECVVADTCIGGVAEAMRAEEKFEDNHVGLTITVTPCWCYGTEVMDNHPFRPKAVWGFNGTERPGAVYLAAAAAGYNQKGMPVFCIYGKDVQDKEQDNIPEDVAEKILIFIRAGLAISEMRNKSYLSIGSVSMGIAGSIIQEAFFQKYLGMRNEYVDMSEVLRRLDVGIYDQTEYDRAFNWVKENFITNKEGLGSERETKSWEASIKMAMIVRDLMIGNPKLKEMGFGEESYGHNAIVAGFQGQRSWTDFMATGDFMEAMLNSTFDWSGIRQPYIIATENDSLNGVSMLLCHLINGSAQIFADVRAYWSPDAVLKATGYKLDGIAGGGFIHMINSGPAALDGTGEQEFDGLPAMKPFWEVNSSDVNSCIRAVNWCYANPELFPGGGFSTDFTTRGGMPVTACRINIMDELGPFIQIAEGYTVNLPPEVENIIDQRTDPTWPSTWFVPVLTGKDAFKDVYSVMNTWGANHAAISYGHIGKELITLCSMLRIPVAMHNVDEANIFRPRCWDAFGSKDLEGSDYRTCKSLGPLYK